MMPYGFNNDRSKADLDSYINTLLQSYATKAFLNQEIATLDESVNEEIDQVNTSLSTNITNTYNTLNQSITDVSNNVTDVANNVADISSDIENKFIVIFENINAVAGYNTKTYTEQTLASMGIDNIMNYVVVSAMALVDENQITKEQWINAFQTASDNPVVIVNMVEETSLISGNTTRSLVVKVKSKEAKPTSSVSGNYTKAFRVVLMKIA